MPILRRMCGMEIEEFDGYLKFKDEDLRGRIKILSETRKH